MGKIINPHKDIEKLYEKWAKEKSKIKSRAKFDIHKHAYVYDDREEYNDE